MLHLGLNAFMTIYSKCFAPTLRLLEFFKKLKCYKILRTISLQHDMIVMKVFIKKVLVFQIV